MKTFKTAPVDMFTTLRPRVMLGPWLDDMKSIQRSIARFGLLSPIVVTKHQGKLVVVDGRKRLAAIRRLGFAGTLPRSLVNVPYIDLADARQTTASGHMLMSNRDLYTTVADAAQMGATPGEIAADMYLSRRCVSDILTLTRLAPRLRQAFFDRTIDFDQARTYAALPDKSAQMSYFLALGPFARPADVLNALQNNMNSVKTTAHAIAA